MAAGARRIRLGAAVLVGAVALGGCVADEAEPEPSAPVSSEAEPTDAELQDEALATATEFLRLVDVSLTELEIPDEMYDVASDEVVAGFSAELQGYRDAGYRLQGSATLTNPVLSPVERPVDDHIRVEMVGCYDTTDSQTVDAAGTPVSGENVQRRSNLLTLERVNDLFIVVDTDFPEEPEGTPGCEP